MDETNNLKTAKPISPRSAAAAALASVFLLWLSGPPLGWWPLAMVALVPWLTLIAQPSAITRTGYLAIWAASTLYWLFVLQGLRHAHPAMYICWVALAGYLGIYHVAFVGLSRRSLRTRLGGRSLPIAVVVPVVWVATECVRNYLLTGISVAMLGHAVANVPLMIQIADLGGTYLVGMVIVCVNVSMAMMWLRFRGQEHQQSASLAIAISLSALIGTIGYGVVRRQTPTGDPLATFALLQRDEAVVYEQSADREIEIFQNYARQSVAAVQSSSRPIDIVLWPESMFSGASPWMIMADDAKVPEQFYDIYPEARQDPSLFRRTVDDRIDYFQQRAQQLQWMSTPTNQPSGPPNAADAANAANAASDEPATTNQIEPAGDEPKVGDAEDSRSVVALSPPAILAGCGVVEYDDSVGSYSAVVHIDSDGKVVDWYGKNHLVMFGEYVPIAPWIPGLRSLIPPGMGLRTGAGGKAMQIGDTIVAPNICIETAVERVAVNQLRELAAEGTMPDVIATVTNDGWFDDSSVIEHHLRCAQLVAVACRRPIVSAANNGPTAWIDSNGSIVKRLPIGANETLIATPRRDNRSSVYVQIGAIPAWICVLLTAATTIRRKPKQK
ncbi:Apolipoprotein N-acyltransferase [Rubripirellula lacrimiformis]|uniref:Apolipoprotein N-acyltransferase n=1 Tax=Rubripirellula lacrimiformis TaxID=1930273 RepID=A0A517NDM9_9BACT|nr:nitrilase-related carbon-nitrogen hydrolase [Rubripirellula lacrimiformis]QDT05240.1 Apolipoprotein N-acyltransferase [Rubripirellula lacrimiformis]